VFLHFPTFLPLFVTVLAAEIFLVLSVTENDNQLIPTVLLGVVVTLLQCLLGMESRDGQAIGNSS
jgi:hypothetical protein